MDIHYATAPCSVLAWTFGMEEYQLIEDNHLQGALILGF